MTTTPQEELDLRQRIDTERDFVALPRYGNSIQRVIDKFPNGVPEHLTARALRMSPRQLQMLWGRILRKLRVVLDVEEEGAAEEQ